MNPLLAASSMAETVILMPGEWCVLQGAGAIETLLGSCVALTIWDPVTATGACCHFVLPGTGASTGPEAVDTNVGKYGQRVIPAMWRALRTRAIAPSRCVHKLFGGGRMFTAELGDIGGNNIACAREMLRRAGIGLNAESVGDDGHRKIRFEVDTGLVVVQFSPLSGGFSKESKS